MRVVQARGEEEKAACYRMRFEVMCEELGWLSTNDNATPEERDEYDEGGQCIPLLALDEEGNAVGTTRVILEGRLPLPVHKYFDLISMPEIERGCGRIIASAEGSRFIARKGTRYRHHEITNALCEGVVDISIERGLSHVYVSFDHKVYRLFRMLGYPVKQIGEATHYMGSLTVPTIIPLESFYLKRGIDYGIRFGRLLQLAV